MHFLSHGQALPGHVQHTKPACTSHPAQVHHTRLACTSYPVQVHHTSTPCTALPHLFHHPSPACTALVQVHTRPLQDHPIQLHHPTYAAVQFQDWGGKWWSHQRPWMLPRMYLDTWGLSSLLGVSHQHMLQEKMNNLLFYIFDEWLVFCNYS